MTAGRARWRATRSSSTSERTQQFLAFPASRPLDRSPISRLWSSIICRAHLIVIGGGYSGLELAQAYRRFGSDVTIIESGPQLMGREDFDVSQEMRRILSDEGIRAFVAAELLRARGKSGEDVSLDVRTSSGEQTIEGSDILVAAGRVPNTAGIGLGEVGVELDGRGYIRVNERLETSAPGVCASANAPAARCSPIYRKTTFGSSAKIWPEGGEARAIGWSLTACSPTRRSRTSD